MPLCYAHVNSSHIVKRVGGSGETKRHLENLGFNIGSEIKIISSLSGNVIVNVKGARVAISNELARKIMV